MYFLYVAYSRWGRSVLTVESAMACANFANVMTFYVSLCLNWGASVLTIEAVTARKWSKHWSLVEEHD